MKPTKPNTPKSRGAIFRADMVRKILDGTKTQTRRPILLRDIEPSETTGYDWDFRDRRAHWNSVTTEQLLKRHPFGKAGDFIYVRETWATNGSPMVAYQADGARKTAIPDGDGGTMLLQGEPLFQADRGYLLPPGWGKWRPSIHMPRWASRIVRRTVEHRVEPLGAIIEADVHAEGFEDRLHFLAVFRGIYGGSFSDRSPVWVTVFSDQNEQLPEST